MSMIQSIDYMKRASKHSNSHRHIPYSSEKIKYKKDRKIPDTYSKIQKSIYHMKEIRKTNDKIFRNKISQIFSMEARYTRRNMADTSQMQNKLLQKKEKVPYTQLTCVHTQCSFRQSLGRRPGSPGPQVRPCSSELLHSEKFTSSHAQIYIYKGKYLH